ncbi:uncharacterized protein TNIN_301481 [Trichonephila inaurata madagascariensis]|uniref:Uncharacterized protein n=1 Tax=Trichonephila inaurata madagascariensis TaxID=2747483 RepID=A0A8X6JTE1_9ARAC|nr:uncharacterized protein TNIN_301481 [Trichonephila inaurata madagascariensis]
MSLMEAKTLKNQLSGILEKGGMQFHRTIGSGSRKGKDLHVESLESSNRLINQLLTERAKEWHWFLEDFNSVSSICIGRCIVHPQATRLEPHGFADASKKCYGAVIYCHSQSTNGATKVKLVTSKSRVAHVKSVTTLWLELCVLLAKLMKRVETALQMKHPVPVE